VTDSSSTPRLTPLQRELLEAFFELPQPFFLTGGGALAGFYTGHRTTLDLDLFAAPPSDLASGVRALLSAAAAIGAVARQQRGGPDFGRFSIERGEELTVVDLVIDRVPQLVPEKPMVGAIRVDALREIAANKLCALVGRSELRDLIDIRELLGAGFDLEALLEDARSKDGGADPATLAWLLSEFPIPNSVASLLGQTSEDLSAFRDDLVARLLRLSLPPEG
jgi:hypothetical protein